MQANRTAPGGPAVTSQDDLAERVQLLEECMQRTIDLLEQTVVTQARLLQMLDDR